MLRVLRAKSRRPGSVGYNNLLAIPFDPVAISGNAAANVAARAPLGLAVKILAVSFVAYGGSGTATANVVSGAGAYETVAAPATQATASIQQSGKATNPNPSSEVYSVTVTGPNGYTATYTNQPASGNTRQQAVAALAAAINADASSPITAVATTIGGVDGYNVTAKTAGTGGNSLSISTASSAQGTGGATSLSGGTNAAAGTAPVLPPADNTYTGAYPPAAAVQGSALFAADVTVPLAAEQTTTAYATDAFDSIWPAGTDLTLRLTSSGSGSLKAIAWAVPVDVAPADPQKNSRPFVPAAGVL